MFPIILIIVLIAFFILSLVVLVEAIQIDSGALGIPSMIVMVVSCIMLFVISIVWPVRYFTSVDEIASMEAFYHNTLDAYEYTVIATGEVNITNAETGLLDIAYKDQGVATSERLRELRDKVEWYNARFRHYERFNTFFIADSFLADLPDDLIPIRLSISEKEEG